jgi:hypothetical protein
MLNSHHKILFVLVLFIFNSSFLIPNCFCQWVQMSNGIGNVNVCALTYDGNDIFAVSYGHGVYLSTNYGVTWTQPWYC